MYFQYEYANHPYLTHEQRIIQQLSLFDDNKCDIDNTLDFET